MVLALSVVHPYAMLERRPYSVRISATSFSYPSAV
jgi:hypothetical protein